MACIQGNVPLSLLYAGTAEETETYCRNLIDMCGKDGGFVLDVGAVADKGQPENLRAMIKAAPSMGATERQYDRQ